MQIQCFADHERDLMGITKAVAAGHITPGEASEIGKLIDTYVRAYETTELDDRVALVEQLTDAELLAQQLMAERGAENVSPLADRRVALIRKRLTS